MKMYRWMKITVVVTGMLVIVNVAVRSMLQIRDVGLREVIL